MSNSTEYSRTILFQTDEFEIVSCVWAEGDSSQFHDHKWSQCYALIQEGEFENILFNGTNEDKEILGVDKVINTPSGMQHSIKCLSKTGKTLHVYSPKVLETEKPNQFFKQLPEVLKQELSLTLNDSGISWRELITSVKQIENYCVNTNSPYFMNQLFSGVQPENLLSESVIARTKTTLATFEASPVFTLAEVEVIKKLGELIGWDQSSEGVCLPGGSAANFMALHCARQKRFPNYKNEGLTNSKVKIFVSEEAHYSFNKACVALGFGLNALELIKADSLGKLIVSDLKFKIERALQEGYVPLMIAATAGTTVLGAFDPILEMSEIAKSHDIWLHVDAAWGGPALFSTEYRHLLKGIELTDSVTFDAHKFFGASLTCSFFLTKYNKILLEANDVSGGDYLFHQSNEYNLDRGKQSWQCGKRADSFTFWTLWKSQGTNGLGKLLNNKMSLQKSLVNWIQDEERLKLIAPPEFLNICVQIIPPEDTKVNPNDWSVKVRESLKDQNISMINYSKKDGVKFLRLIIAHPHVNLEHLKTILTEALLVK